ncbi:MAG: threonine synthase [Candidatus Marsarchaeota archaeon]|nr:threonine synthase [Candidatus Marsarchaeota archaeon]
MDQRFSYLESLACPKCSSLHDPRRVNTVCECGSPLLAMYDLDAAASRVRKDSVEGRQRSVWRYHELLPVYDSSNIVSLGEGFTPLIQASRLGAEVGVNGLFIKDEGVLPTGTFKARGAAVGVSKAKELNISKIAMPTNGNAGAAWAAYCSKAGIDAHIVMPKDAPKVTMSECAALGAKLYLVDGLIGDAAKVVGRSSQSHGFFDASTFREPYRVEGKKTMGLEIFEQLLWQSPDVVLYPTGGGVGLIGIYKAYQELLQLDWVSSKPPRLVAVQSEGCSPVVKAWEKRLKECEPWPNPSTVAFGINVAKPLADFLILDAVYKTDGCAVSVSDQEILDAQRQAGRLEGVFMCPEGAAVIAAAKKLRESNWIETGDRVVALNTGAGIKYPETCPPQPTLISPDDTI